MKKNITINLCGRLFAIDEDAYEMLYTYEQSLRNYFRSREGGEEIADDIEARIAELLDELKQNGTEAVTIEHVTEIIHRIGRPDEMEESVVAEEATDEGIAQNAETEAPSATTVEAPAKRLYRNPDDKKVMGVLSGFAAYFGGDPLWWRMGYIGVLALCFMNRSFDLLWFLPHNWFIINLLGWGFVLIVAYILLAVLMPVAATPEDRLRMKGKEVNPQNLAEEVTNSNKAASEEAKEACPSGHRGPLGCAPAAFGCIGGFFTAIWAVISALFRWCIYAAGAFVAVMCLVGIFMLTVVAFNPIDTVFSSTFMQSPEFAAILPNLKGPFFVFFACAIIVMAITAYAIIHSLLNEFKQMPAMPYRQRIVLLVIWFGGLIGAGAALASRWLTFIDAENKYTRRVTNEWRDRCNADDSPCYEEDKPDTVCNVPYLPGVARQQEVKSEPQDTTKTRISRIVVVRQGETLSDIAKRYHTTVNMLRHLNGQKANHLRPGQRLRVR